MSFKLSFISQVILRIADFCDGRYVLLCTDTTLIIIVVVAVGGLLLIFVIVIVIVIIVVIRRFCQFCLLTSTIGGVVALW